MKVTFFASDKDREYDIAKHFCEGVKKAGDTYQVMPTADYDGPGGDTDVAVFIGIKGWSRLLMETHMEAGKHAIILDKGYVGGPHGPRSKYVRCSIDALQPHAYFQCKRPDSRIKELGIKMSPRRHGQNIIIAGGSLKYALWHRFNGNGEMDPMTLWAHKLANNLVRQTKRPLVYRPKPSWIDAVRIPHCRFSRPPISIEDELKNAHCLVTYGSNAGVDALIAGVPVFTLGDGITLPVSSPTTKKIEEVFFPDDDIRWQFLADVSFCQFSLPEFASGLGWSILRPQIENMKSVVDKSFGDE